MKPTAKTVWFLKPFLLDSSGFSLGFEDLINARTSGLLSKETAPCLRDAVAPAHEPVTAEAL